MVEQIEPITSENSRYVSNYSLKFLLSKSNKEGLKIKFSCDPQLYKTTSDELLAKSKFDIEYFFIISGLAELVDEKGIDFEMAKRLGNIVLGTSRGIVFAQCQGTVLEKMILPIMPTADFEKLFGVDKSSE